MTAIPWVYQIKISCAIVKWHSLFTIQTLNCLIKQQFSPRHSQRRADPRLTPLLCSFSDAQLWWLNCYQINYSLRESYWSPELNFQHQCHEPLLLLRPIPIRIGATPASILRRSPIIVSFVTCAMLFPPLYYDEGVKKIFCRPVIHRLRPVNTH